MKVLFCGDKHLKITRFDLAKQFLSWLNKTIEQEKPDLYVALGDDLDTHAVVRSELLTELRYHFDYVLSLGIPVVYVVGNHDCFRPNDMKYHAFHAMKNIHPNLHIVDTVQDLYGMTFVPYIHNPDNFPKETREICVAHQTFKGADYGDITTKDGVDAANINGCEYIISGHIHKRHILDSSRVRVFYPGSPFSQSASDINQVKGVSLFDTSSFVERFICSPLPRWVGLKYDIVPSFSVIDMHEELKLQLNDKDHFVIDIYGPKAEIIGYLGSNDGKKIISGRNVKIKTSFTDNEKRQIKIETTSLDNIVSDFIDKVYLGTIDKNKLKSKAKEVYKRLGHSGDLV